MSIFLGAAVGRETLTAGANIAILVSILLELALGEIAYVDGGATLRPRNIGYDAVSVSINFATYRGEQGFSGAAVVRLTPRVYVTGGIAGLTVKGAAFGF